MIIQKDNILVIRNFATGAALTIAKQGKGRFIISVTNEFGETETVASLGFPAISQILTFLSS